MKKAFIIIALYCISNSLAAQDRDTVNMYYYKNSLYNHLETGNSDANASTNVGNWIARFVAQANSPKSATLGSVFGFFPSWSTPPRAHNFHDEISTPYLEKWTYSWTGAENINLLGFVPDNFDGQNFDPSDTTNMGEAYVTKLIQLIDEWEENAPNYERRYVVYAGWPALNKYGGTNDDPATLTEQGLSDWRTYGLGKYQNWMELLVKQLQDERPNLNIGLHNISKAVLMCHENTNVGKIKPEVLFEDLAPHGRSSWYFLAAVAEYIELFDEKPSSQFTFNAQWGVDTAITSNYEPLVDYIWTALKGASASTHQPKKESIIFYPNPAHTWITINNLNEPFQVSVFDGFGKLMIEQDDQNQLNIGHLKPGTYFISFQTKTEVRKEVLIIH